MNKQNRKRIEKKVNRFSRYKKYSIFYIDDFETIDKNWGTWILISRKLLFFVTKLDENNQNIHNIPECRKKCSVSYTNTVIINRNTGKRQKCVNTMGSYELL